MGASCGAGGWSVSVLSIAGEQGSAKTLQSKLLRALIDRSVAPVRALPRDERELFIAANNGHVLGLRQSQWAARLAVRRAMPGRHRGAFSTRRLFTDHSVSAMRPVILNGIEDTSPERISPTVLSS